MNSSDNSDKFTNLVDAWNKFDSTPFNDWVIEFSDTYFRSGLTLKMAANFLKTQPAELQAVINLAALDEENLAMLAQLKPPNTTWFSLASASTEGLKAAIKALASARVVESPFLLVDGAIRAVEGPNIFERIAGLRSDAFGYAAKKAQTFSLLNEKGIKALKGWQSKIRSGKTLTSPQMAYADGLLRELVEGGAIQRNSKDNDKEICDEILDALGYD